MSNVWITAYSLCNALGMETPEIAEALKAGKTGLAPSEQDVPFDTFDGAISGQLPQLPERLSAWSTRSAQIIFSLWSQLGEQATSVRQRYSPDRIGIILGTSTAGADRTEDAYRVFLKEGDLPPDYDLWRHHTYGATLHVLRELTGANGPAWMHSTACTSSAKPFGSAVRLLEQGSLDAVIVGGVDTLCSMTLQGFHALGALSSSLCKPFSAERAGINIGEGGGLMLLEKASGGIARVAGVGESSDAYHIAAPHPKGLGAELAMQRALQAAGMEPPQIDYINAHGTGTQLNDSAESQAIERVFGTDTPVVSTKGYTGHTLGGAGVTEIGFSVLAIEQGWIPASLGADPIDESIKIQIPNKTETGEFHNVISNSFAFGGNNISVLLSST